MTQKAILVIGSGGREHALAWVLARSPQVEHVYVAPGNGGTAWPAETEASGLRPRAGASNVDIAVDDVTGLVNFAQEKAINLTVVGPEVSLAAGVVDAFQAAGLSVFGPTQQVARLESSKTFAKDFMQQHHIPTGQYQTFDTYQAAVAYLKQITHKVVIKADGLAAGKGVMVCDDAQEAQQALHQIMIDKAFGQAGDRVLIEERLSGPEISILAWSDGKTIVPIVPARDHKPAYDGDQGPNTGGMGAYAPAPDVGSNLMEMVQQTILQPVIDGLAAQGTPYMGVLYAGLMLTPTGPKVLEFNCRFGDPETQVTLPLLKTDILDIFEACVVGRLDQVEIQWSAQACATVVMASPGYPGSYPKGIPVRNLAQAEADENTVVFHAGTARLADGWVTSGGRVLNVTAIGDTLGAALAKAYAGIKTIHFENAHFRQDIGQKYRD